MSSAVVELPSYIALRSQYDRTILRCIKEESESQGFVHFQAKNVRRAEAKFEVHSSKIGHGLVHIRSCYNNKYLVLNETNDWIVAKAEKPEEDHLKRSCTLLRPTSVDGDPKKIRLTIVHVEHKLCLWRADAPYYGCVMAKNFFPDADSCDVFNVIDWQSLAFLPNYAAFKGDNDKFLTVKFHRGRAFLQFSVTEEEVEDDVDILRVGNKILKFAKGTIFIRNLGTDAYWRLSPNWIWADSPAPNTAVGTIFEPVKISDDTIALKNVFNNLFCTRLTTDGIDDCLNAGSATINEWAKFKVFEFILSRTIENIKFRLMDARIYGESIVAMVSSSHTNQGSTSQEHTLDLSYTDKSSSSWNCTLSMKSSIKTSLKVGIPFIEEGEVKLGFEIAGEHMWGETKEVEKTMPTSYKVTVPPKTKVTALVTVTRGSCDIPFSYTQHDVLHTGETETTEMDDGVYTGVHNYFIYIETKEESLIENPNVATAGFKKVAKVSPSGVITPI